jgi:membrane protein YdbS with pleckstrin-like domain
MEPIRMRPEKAQKTLWLVSWGIPFVMGTAALVVLLLVTEEEVFVGFALGLVGWLLVMSLILLWIPAFYKSLEYVIEADCVKAKGGVLWRKQVTVPFTKMTNLDVTQGPVQRMLDIGTIHVQTAGAGGQEGSRAELRLLGIRELDEVKDSILERARGYTASVVEPARSAAVQEDDSHILGQILKELTAIRQALEKQ